MPRPEQDATLRALTAGEVPDELIFDPITDNDSNRSCLGCLWALVGAAGLLIGLDAADHYRGWQSLERVLAVAGKGGLVALALMIAICLFTVFELASNKEVYVLETVSGKLELRDMKGKTSKVIQSWDSEQIARFLLDLPDAVPSESPNSCLYVMLRGGEQIRLLEACYPRDFVQQIERRLSEICEIPSTT